jgi:hypothetical protein
MTPQAQLRVDVYQEGQRAFNSGVQCPYHDWRWGTWNKGYEAARLYSEALAKTPRKTVYAPQSEYSLDDGATWHMMVSPIRAIYREVGGVRDLHVTLTSEGVTYDLVDHATGEVISTKAAMAADIPEELF